MTRKEKVEGKRAAQINEWLTIFRRSYEMSRAWGAAKVPAMERAFAEVNEAAWSATKMRPQEGMFLLDCKISFRDIASKTVEEYPA